ncbi:mitochondrial cardiolipin hydrolase [Drosophila mauritiana]|uniref:Mitochondrial cardiolipin hydrolase n=1 Tax=Drosophila mauritiana TaxID=7226 RepID=A0A6P8JQL9_DROMA|nr:mitochondrial cardiolipin hydrolase [Drosophila mauritiana]
MLITQIIMKQIRDYPIVTTLSIAVGTVLASEVIWKLVQCSRNKREKASRVHEVIVFNELGEICAAAHMRNNSIGSQEPQVSPCCNAHCSLRNVAKIAEQIDRAVYSIDLAIFTFSSLYLADALKRALQRGVIIRIISDGEMVYCTGSQITMLAQLGVPVRVPITTNLMHNKFCIIDGVERVEEIRLLRKLKWMRPCYSIVISGSLNWTAQGLGGNWENCIITADEKLTATFQAEFQRMWRAFGKTEASQIQPK